MKKKGTRRCLHQDTKSLITPSLHLCFFQDYIQLTFSCRQLDAKLLCCAVCFAYIMQTNKQHVKAKQRCRDGVMSDFVSWCRHLLVPFFFMK